MDPKNGTDIVMVIATSQIEKKKEFVRARNLPLETLVEVSKNDYIHFTKDTIFDCNSVHIKTVDELINKLIKNNLQTFRETISERILRKILIGVKKSPLVKRSYKKLIF